MKRLIIAIDGPAASGKSSVAKLIAERLHLSYLDTGAMYRAYTLLVLLNNTDPYDEEKVVSLKDKFDIEFNGKEVFLNKENVTKSIRSSEVTKYVSIVCAYKVIREIMVDKQREIGNTSKTGIVMDGRDIGTVVFPNADLKIYLTASYEKRAQRRFLENLEKNIESSPVHELIEELKQRDYLDSHRENSPLCKASDAIEIDNSDITLEETADLIIKKAHALGAK